LQLNYCVDGMNFTHRLYTESLKVLTELLKVKICSLFATAPA